MHLLPMQPKAPYRAQHAPVAWSGAEVEPSLQLPGQTAVISDCDHHVAARAVRQDRGSCLQSRIYSSAGCPAPVRLLSVPIY